MVSCHAGHGHVQQDEVHGGRILLNDGDCGRTICCRHHCVTGAFQHALGELQDHLLVVHDKYGLVPLCPLRVHFLERWRLCLHWFPAPWQICGERCSLPDCGFHDDPAVGLLDRPVDDREAQAGSMSDRLGGKEWLEQVLQHSVGHAAAGVDHLQEDMFTRSSLGMCLDKPVVNVDVLGPDGQRSCAIHGVPGVEDEVDDELSKLNLVDENVPEARCIVPGDCHGGRHQFRDGLQREVDRLVEVEVRWCWAPIAAERQQVVCEAGSSSGSLLSLGQRLCDGIQLPGFFPHDAQVSKDTGQQVVEVMGDSTRHEAEGIHFLCLEQVSGHALAVGNVHQQSELSHTLAQRSDVEVVGALNAVADEGQLDISA